MTWFNSLPWPVQILLFCAFVALPLGMLVGFLAVKFAEWTS